MTYFENIKEMDIDALAAFIYGLIDSTEEKIQKQLHKQGIEFDRISVAPEIQIANHKRFLNSEVKEDV